MLHIPKIGLYGFSADPITYGHLDIIKRSLNIFDKLHVCVFNNSEKKYTLEYDERLRLVKKTLEEFPKVIINGFEGLLVDYAYKYNIKYLVRGIRNITDLNYEADMSYGNLSQLGDIETIYLFAKPELTHISSTMTKIIKADHGDLKKYVPPVVKQSLEKTIDKQYRLIITGSISSGKSSVVQHIINRIKLKNNLVHEIDMDKITAEIYDKKDELYKEALFSKLKKRFGKTIIKDDGSVDKRSLSKIVFKKDIDSNLRDLDEIMKEPLLYEIRKQLKNRIGLIFISGAIIPEKNWLSIANNNVLFIDISKDVQLERLIKRDNITKKRAVSKIKYASTSRDKLDLIKKRQKEDNYGQTIIYSNDTPMDDKKIDKIIAKIYLLFPDIKKISSVSKL